MTRLIRVHMKELSDARQHGIESILDACDRMDQIKIEEEAVNLARIASNHMLAAFKFSYRDIAGEAPSQLLLTIGTEILLNAIIILKAPKMYIKLCGENKKPPSFEKAKSCAKQIIVADFDDTQKHRMNDVLDVIQSKRNIFAHFSLGIHAHYYQHYEMLNVICYLLSRYFSQLSSRIETLKIMKEKFRMKDDLDYDYVIFNN